MKTKRAGGAADQLPPGVEIWQDGYRFLLVEQLPYTPSRFVLGRYASRAAAVADAWDAVTRHGAVQKMVAATMERASARTAERRTVAHTTQKARPANGR